MYKKLLAANMETLLSIIALIAIPTFLAIRHLKEYGAFNEPETWGVSEKAAFVLFLLYVGMVLVLGKDGVYTLHKPVSQIREDSFIFYFILPGLGLGIAMFPRVAAEFSESYLSMMKFGMLRYFGIYGWTIVFALVFIVML